MLRNTRLKDDPIPSEAVERFLAIVLKYVPAFDIEAARLRFLRPDSLYEFDLPIPAAEYDVTARKIRLDFEESQLPADLGRSIGTRPGFFVLYRNFVVADAHPAADLRTDASR